ncbi:16S rRNA (cytidine(1402)-2'-O)-methyltransferase [Aidingimonas halophila]|uniref:Ribosomal RNA small subunit methyltransferase I n=1 Tax=Aidingimonas halophila TaxID=574349 RepID=A0A1H2QTJ7_9GAMM|nr:16S rRNA (cytidine(1402)-2'-O)-methyltransferase [Aidingimonas halophila]GHC20258.1 ribosomal RNA small subunit methyltransferase I [Aidingimonas halophila]SDW10471.1 16S rRNA (cytidine1402-2'-O)-methyltransferase [Aidingimonas halophila]
MTVSAYGALYVVATPIGNLDDLTARAAHVLGNVALIAVEDTRHSGRLLRHFGVERPLMSLHEHNEHFRIAQIAACLERGEDVALISDAGTPLISDPGFLLVRALREAGHRIIPIPGACALIAALSASGLPTDSFSFHGFLPAKSSARRSRLEMLAKRPETLVFYESPHRIRHTLKDIEGICGERRVVLARELTKTFETFLEGAPAQLQSLMERDPDQSRGEFVVMLEGADSTHDETAVNVEGQRLVDAMIAEKVGVKQVAAVASKLLGGGKKDWYERAQLAKERAQHSEQ